MGQHVGVLCALSALPFALAWAWTLCSAPADLCPSRSVGRVARATRFSACAWLGRFSGGSRHVGAPHVGQRRMDVWVLAVLAGMLSNGNCQVAESMKRDS